jgi:lincosamide nucleotidyltransferase A/C/D/E
VAIARYVSPPWFPRLRSPAMDGERTGMTATDVLTVVDAMADAGVPSWVAGGWGIDALVGETTRAHRDLDAAIPAELDAAAMTALAPLGYQLTLDERPARFVLSTPGGRLIDLHPVVFDPDGHGVQQGFDGQVFEYPPHALGEGVIADRTVRCLSVEQQIRFHLGYEPLEHDRQDMALLRERLGIELPRPY